MYLGLKSMFFSYIFNHIVSSFSPPNEIAATIIHWFVLKKIFLFHVIFYAKGSFKKFCACFSFICCLSISCMRTLFFHRCSLLSEDTCFLSFYAVQSLAERSNLYISL